MKKQFKKITAMLCVVSLMVTGLGFMPQNAKADTWFDAVFDTPETTPPTPWYHHHTDATAAGAEDGIWDYTGPNGYVVKYKGGDNVEGFAWNIITKQNEANWLETDNLMDVPCVKQGGSWVKPVPGMSYKLNMTIDYTNSNNGDTQLQVWNTNGFDGEVEHKDVEDNYIFNPRKGNIQWSCENVDVFLMPGNEFKIHLGIGVSASYAYNYKITAGCTFTISKFELVPDGEYEVVPSNDDTFKPSADVGGQTVYSPWTLSAHWIPDTDPDPQSDNGSYGVMLYNVDPATAEDIDGTTMKLANTVDGPEKYSDGTRITDPADRWWWVSGSLLDIAEDVGLEEKYDISSGTISLNSSKATGTDCYLYVYVDNTEYQFSLQAGDNTLTIPEFIYAGGKDIKFLFDELPKNTVIKVNDISFEQEADSWNTVPNEDSTFMQGPWNMFGNFIEDVPGEEPSGNYGVLQYKENKVNPTSYKDYDFRVASNSGWLAWSVFARLENYCADYLDPGDSYNITIKLNSSKATIPTAKEDDLDQLLVVVGSDMYYFDLDEGANTLTIHGDNYKFDPAEPHEQILLEMDGLQKGTVLTVTDIQVSGPNDGWTNVPNKQDTVVGDWTLFGLWDDTHWSKIAYKANGTGSGIGSLDFKNRRITGDAAQMACTASLEDYLTTAKDDKGHSLSHGDTYNTKIKIKATGATTSALNLGTVRVVVNGKPFIINLQSGTNTYDLYDITGEYFTYNNTIPNKAVEFGFDETTAKTVITIPEVKFYNMSGSGEDVPNDQAVNPDGTPWTLYAITDPSASQYGALKYNIIGDPAKLSSLKINVKSVSGWFGAQSVFASLVDRLAGLEDGKQYNFTIKAVIDESNVTEREVTYDKKLRININEKNFDYDIPATPTGTQTYTGSFTYDASQRSDNVAFQLDQMLKGTIFSVESVEITDPSATTTPAPTTTKETTTQETTTETSSVVPSTETTTVAPSTEAPSSETAVVTTTSATVKAPGKAAIKKIYKKKKSAKKLKVKLKKTKGANGYQVAVYKSKKTAKKNKKALVKKYTKKLKVTIKSKKLKKKKKLYVRARAYALDGTGKKVFGKWSAIKKAKVKK